MVWRRDEGILEMRRFLLGAVATLALANPALADVDCSRVTPAQINTAKELLMSDEEATPLLPNGMLFSQTPDGRWISRTLTSEEQRKI
jgi:hypothetical protein